MEIELYTDGACKGNPGAGAWAYIIQFSGSKYADSGFKEHTTNNQMEIMAALQGILFLRFKGFSGDICVYSDSKYLINCMTQKWYINWIKNNWLKRDGSEVKNKLLWIKLLKVAKGLNIKWKWVKGHSGNVLNELCDSLCNDEINKNIVA